MLKSWEVENFKSLTGKVPIDLGEITVLCGANSSGKSSIIQSILLLKQTLSSGQRNRQLTLNGPLVKLGTFKNICSNSSSANTLSINFCINNPPQWGYDAFGPTEHEFSQELTTLGNLVSPDKVSCKFSWQSASEEKGDIQQADLYPFLSAANVDVAVSPRISGEKHTYSLSVAPRANAPKGTRSGDLVIYDVSKIDARAKTEAIADRPDGVINACIMSSFIPDDLVIAFSAKKYRAKQISDAIFQPSPMANASILDEPYSDAIVTVVNAWLNENQLAPFRPSANSPRIRSLRAHIMDIRRRVVRPSSDGLTRLDFTELRARLETGLAGEPGPQTDIDFKMPNALRSGHRLVREFFASKVHYLGPLRDEPKPVYPLEALSRSDDVGVRGEHTAAVLDLNKHTVIQYFPPSAIRDDGFVGEMKRDHLAEALRDWLAYLGVASAIESFETGVFGHQLKVRPHSGGDMHDLTHVGVGVSQVLPIVLMSLLAPKGSLLIFEQPELHLHPKVQSRLADFFLAVSKSGKQCLLETHSEYLVDRFRRRIAESPDASMNEKVRIYFTSRRDARTVCLPIEITRYGSIVNWPDDFFDQSQEETERLLKAAMKKRSAERKSQ